MIIDGVELARVVDHGGDPRDRQIHCYGAQRASDGAWRWLWLEQGRFHHWANGGWWRRDYSGQGCGWVEIP